jgi:hypothetical protein
MYLIRDEVVLLFLVKDQQNTQQHHSTWPNVRNESSAPQFSIANKLEQRDSQANDHEPEVFALD